MNNAKIRTRPRLLLITPSLYGIEEKLIAYIENSGFEVVWIENRVIPLDYHAVKSKMRLIRKIFFLIYSPQARYLRNELRKIDNKKFDILFFINGHLACQYLFKKLKLENTDLFSLLYLWDSFSMYSWVNELKLFDKVYTFDPVDARKYALEYKPNFNIYSDEDEKFPYEDRKRGSDIFFVGKLSPSRYFFIEKLLPQLIRSDIDYYIKVIAHDKIFLHSLLIYKFLKAVKLRSRWIEFYLINYIAVKGLSGKEYILNNYIDFEDTRSQFLSANVILDLSFSSQSGYSHRLISALGYGKKVITTNEYIRNESFYNSDQVLIIKDNTERIDFAWLRERKSFQPVSEFSDLNINNWINSLINVESS